MVEEKLTDVTKYPDGPREIIKHMDFMPDDEDLRMKFFMAFLSMAAGL